MAGHICGTAPLFERFTLGDSTTLRGWNKYEVAPAGGDSMFHVSGEYRYRGLAIFTDVGSVWDQRSECACARRQALVCTSTTSLRPTPFR